MILGRHNYILTISAILLFLSMTVLLGSEILRDRQRNDFNKFNSLLDYGVSWLNSTKLQCYSRAVIRC